ncbi:MAG: AAA family ATPase [Actinophytocola sp.]|nr:AAA family ATPase [Actinophytocola sp.]
MRRGRWPQLRTLTGHVAGGARRDRGRRCAPQPGSVAARTRYAGHGMPDAECDSATLADSLRRVVRLVADDGPAVLVLEDLHWADAATLDILPALALAIEGEPVLIVATYRSDQLPRAHPLRRARTELRRGGGRPRSRCVRSRRSTPASFSRVCSAPPSPRGCSPRSTVAPTACRSSWRNWPRRWPSPDSCVSATAGWR